MRSMPSPFPGMDPYLEDPDFWPDFHLTYLVTMRAELNRTLPERYNALIYEYRWDEGYKRRNRYVDIHETRDGPTRTVIELISPVQKRVGRERRIYLARRRDYLAKDIDLLE